MDFMFCIFILGALWAIESTLDKIFKLLENTRDYYSFEKYADGKYRIKPAKSDIDGTWY